MVAALRDYASKEAVREQMGLNDPIVRPFPGGLLQGGSRLFPHQQASGDPNK